MQAHNVLKLAANKKLSDQKQGFPSPTLPPHRGVCGAVDPRLCVCLYAFPTDPLQLSLEDAGFLILFKLQQHMHT